MCLLCGFSLATGQERAKESDRRMERLEQRENMAEKAEEVTKMAVTVFHCREVGYSSRKERVPLYFTLGCLRCTVSPTPSRSPRHGHNLGGVISF